MSTIILIAKHIFLSGLLVAAGFAILKYTNRLIQWFGYQDFFEQYMPGGSVGFWKLIGIFCVIAGIFALVGKFSFVGF